MIDRLLSFLVALSLAFLVWMYTRSRNQDTLDNVPIPVQITLTPGQAEQYDLDVPEPCQVTASFSGAPSRIRELRSLLHQGKVCVDIPLTVPEHLQNESPYLDTVRVSAADIPVPLGVTPLVVEGRNRIPVTLHRLVERRLPVRFHHSLEDRIAQVVVEPATVLVRGPREILDRTTTISTRYLGFESATEGEIGTEQVVPLAREIEGRMLHATPPVVRVRFRVRPTQKVYELSDVPVAFLCPANFGLRPQFSDDRAGKISLRVQGPSGEEPPVVSAFIDLTGGKFKAGLHADEPLRFQLPKDYQLEQKPPRSASFQLIPIELPTRERDAIRVP